MRPNALPYRSNSLLAVRNMLLGSVFTLIVLLVLCGCGGSGPSSGGQAGGNGSAITDQSRAAAIKGVEDKWFQLNKQNLAKPVFNQALADFMAARPEFEASGVNDDLCAWGRFKDGRLLVVANNRDPEPVTKAARMDGTPTRAAAELPVSKQARLMHSFGPNFDQLQQPINDVADWLRIHGYTIAGGTEGDARLSTLRSVSGDGFFYLNTHGARGKTRDGKETFCASSSTLFSTANDNLAEIKDDLDHYRVAYITAPNGDSIGGNRVADTRYGITAAFVDAYMSFGKNSVVFLNVCFSAKTNIPEGAGAFINTCLKKGAGVYFGWTALLAADPAFKSIRYFVDRMVGSNRYKPESPDQRAFAYVDVLADMKKNGLGIDPKSGAQLTAFPNTGVSQPILLAPSIQFMDVDEESQKLVINGMFGTDQDQVTISGTQVTVLSWAKDKIEVKLPLSGPASSGDVIVTSKNRKSNVVQLTEWHAKFKTTLSLFDGDLKQTGVLDVRIRADIHSHRDKPAETPFETVVPFQQTQDSFGKFTASGTHSEPGVTTIWKGSSDLPARQYNPTAPNLVLCFGSIDTKQKKIDMALQGAATKGMTVTIISKSGTVTVDLPGSTGFLDGNLNASQPVPSVRLSMNSDYSIPAGVREEFDGTTKLRLEWTAIAPIHPPDPDAARSIRSN